jgi:hypothetical protein
MFLRNGKLYEVTGFFPLFHDKIDSVILYNSISAVDKLKKATLLGRPNSLSHFCLSSATEKEIHDFTYCFVRSWDTATNDNIVKAKMALYYNEDPEDFIYIFFKNHSYSMRQFEYVLAFKQVRHAVSVFETVEKDVYSYLRTYLAKKDRTIKRMFNPKTLVQFIMLDEQNDFKYSSKSDFYFEITKDNFDDVFEQKTHEHSFLWKIKDQYKTMRIKKGLFELITKPESPVEPQDEPELSSKEDNGSLISMLKNKKSPIKLGLSYNAKLQGIKQRVCEQAKKDNGFIDLIINNQVITIPRKPAEVWFERFSSFVNEYTIAKEKGWHLISEKGLKCEGDSAAHSDWWIGAGLPLNLHPLNEHFTGSTLDINGRLITVLEKLGGKQKGFICSGTAISVREMRTMAGEYVGKAYALHMPLGGVINILESKEFKISTTE